ncbi:MAG: methicillin resistance protein, partial [Desulfobacterales bacterium]|nr:methicillin resistance protein [Desulfobacterales bacterium]
FDFGRSMPDSGVHEYKKAFGSQTQFLDYRYYLNSIDEIPNNTTSSKKRQKFSNVWKKMPLPLTRLIGPQLRKEFP